MSEVNKLTAERDSIRDALRIVQAASIAHAGEQNGVIAALREQVRGLKEHILSHDASCQDLCGIGEQEAAQCGYRAYFLHSGRRCPNCPVHDQIGLPIDAALASKGEGL